ncbi:bZIP transcription factor [Natrinema altunense]|uniref:BZIP transcription factor n=1 Tax=Natrinema altunense TaxID=222984 RepID=A0A482XZV5_9EURY|nr:bZIP transcription factor [Natrinema altunense]RZH68752.1 bZIP transcription factor [Natrinema altunense]
MPEQIIIRLDDLEEVITYDEWREFVEDKRGKWRGAHSEEGAQALRAYVDGKSDEGDENDVEKERLQEEIERLKAENDRLAEENQRLHEQLAGDAPRGGYSDSGATQTKNDVSESTYLASDSDADSEKADETDETGVFAWDAYDPDAEGVVIPEDALKVLPEEFDPVDDAGEFVGEQVPAINPDHVEEDEIPGRTGNAKTALVAGILRYRGNTVTMGEVVSTTKDVLDISTPSYARQGVVLGNRDSAPEPPVVAWLAGRHPDGDEGEWVTSVNAFHEIIEKKATEAATRRGHEVERHVGLAFGAVQFLDEKKRLDGPRLEGYKQQWEDALFPAAVEGEDMHPLAAHAVQSALFELYDSVDARAKSGNWEKLWEEWPPGDEEAEIEDGELSAEALIRWWDAEYRRADEQLPDEDVEMAAETLEPWVPDERRPFRDAEDNHAAEKAEDVDEMEEIEEAEVASDAEEVDELERVEQGEQESAS